MNALQAMVRKYVRRMGWDVIQLREFGHDPFADLARLLGNAQQPKVILDVGANLGQTAAKFYDALPRIAKYVAIEPSPGTFAQMQANLAGRPNVQCVNAALGSTRQTLEFLENSYSDMSSFLEPTAFCVGRIVGRTAVQVERLDDMLSVWGCDVVDCMKLDTQGFDLEVLRGGSRSLRQGFVKSLLIECTFMDTYKNAPPFWEVIRELDTTGFRLVDFYKMHHRHSRANWCDALFVHDAFDTAG